MNEYLTSIYIVNIHKKYVNIRKNITNENNKVTIFNKLLKPF